MKWGEKQEAHSQLFQDDYRLFFFFFAPLPLYSNRQMSFPLVVAAGAAVAAKIIFRQPCECYQDKEGREK